MPNYPRDSVSPANLRERALHRLTSPHQKSGSRLTASQALSVLHELASSPETAGDALALLHELQVHQVELELQEEELRQSCSELEARLGRQAQLYDFSPAACFTIDQGMIVRDVNEAAARLFGVPGAEISGNCATAYMSADSAVTVRALLKAGVPDDRTEAVTLQLFAAGGKLRSLRTAVGRDPLGQGIIIAVFPAA